MGVYADPHIFSIERLSVDMRARVALIHLKGHIPDHFLSSAKIEVIKTGWEKPFQKITDPAVIGIWRKLRFV